MVYRQRYYKEITHEDGKVIRLEFWTPDDSIADAVEMGDVIQSLNLEIQSGGDIDQPIVKTQLNFTLIDAPDHELSKTKKCGSWEEFYSPSATAWLVMVGAKKAGESGFKNIWGGYITPDSFRESLTYRAGVSFIARDNIGHMQDFPFDAEGNAEGMIKLGELIELAWEKIASPMLLTIETNNAQWLQTYGHNALNTYMNISAFKDKNWYEVLESVLYSYGLVMRYVGNNNVVIYPLRNLPEYGYRGSEELVPIFETGAERELSPAVRRIEESMDYSSSEFVVKLPTTKDLSGSYIEREDNDGAKWQCWPLANYQDGQGWINKTPSNTIVVNPQAYSFSSDVNITDEQMQYVYDHLFLRCGLSGGVEYSRFVIPSPVELTLTLGKMVYQGRIEGASGHLQEVFLAYEDDEAEQWLFPQIHYAVSIKQNGITNWLQADGTFSTTSATLTYKFGEGYNRSLNVRVDLSKFNGQALFTFHIKQISGLGGIAQGWLIALEGLTIKAGGSALTANHVNTNYREENNVILSRNPQIAPAMANTLLPSMVENGIFYKSGDFYYPANKWSWNGNAAQQMAVYNHLQLLCFYAKPNNILTGNILNSDVTNFARIYRWNGTEHIITSGTLNLLNGFIENASLREFMRYEDMWGDMTDEAGLPDVDSGTMSTVQGGTGSTSNASTYSNTTEVNIGGGGGTIVLDSYMSDSSTNGVQNRVIKAYVDSENSRQDESITTIIQSVLQLGQTLSAMWELSDDGKQIITTKEVVVENNAIVSGDVATAAEGQNTPSGGVTDEDLKEYAKQSWVQANYQPLITESNPLSYTKISGLGSLASKNSLSASDIPDLSSTYLPKSGGELTKSGSEILRVSANGANYATIAFRNKPSGASSYNSAAWLGYNGASGDWFVTNGGWSVTNILYHTGNFNPANYMPLIGGVISGDFKVNGTTTLKTVKIWNGGDTVAEIKIDGSSLSINKELKLTNGGSADISSSIAAAFKTDIAQIKTLIANDVYIGASGGTTSNLAFNINTYQGVSDKRPNYKQTVFSVDTLGNGTLIGGLTSNTLAANYFTKSDEFYFGSGASGIGASGALIYTYNNLPIYFYTSGSLAMTIDGGHGVTMESGLHVKGIQLCNGTLHVGSTYSEDGQSGTAGVTIRNEGGIEISHASTPYIDFHYANDTGDYSVRMAAKSTSVLSFRGNLSSWYNNGYNLGTSDVRWKKLWATNGDFAGDLEVGGNLIVTGDVATL
jgi:cytoskeletal protein CcmA (bactofilin family)